MNKKKLLPKVLLFGGLLAGAFYYGHTQKSYNSILDESGNSSAVVHAVYTGASNLTDFEKAAQAAVPSVVHIKTVTHAKQIARGSEQDPMGDMFGGDEFFKKFFGDGGGRQFSSPEQRASGSGVIVSNDGYIVTNNHVVDGANDITVTLSDSRHSYKAKVIGTDPNTDLALIKISASNLPVMAIGNSDDLHLGQGVLAIGYPLNLDVTVTQGIISAKSRNIGINNSKAPIESFIQTDAAVNPGSSGGALVNANGELIGINAAIASPTGSYAGYAYAIPSNLMKKVIGDIMKFGTVQRGYLGISYAPDNLDDEKKKELGIKDDLQGIYVMDVDPEGGAAQAGVRKGDEIIAIDGVSTTTGPSMAELVGRHKPGDKIKVTLLRDNQTLTKEVELKGKVGSFASLKPSAAASLGLAVQDLSKEEANSLGLNGGVKVMDIKDGVISEQTNMKPGFIITKVAGHPVGSIVELKDVLSKTSGNFQIEGYYPDSKEPFYYGINGFNK